MNGAATIRKAVDASVEARVRRARIRYDRARPEIERRMAQGERLPDIARALGYGLGHFKWKVLPAVGLSAAEYRKTQRRAATARKVAALRPEVERMIARGDSSREIAQATGYHPKYLLQRILPQLGLKPNPMPETQVQSLRIGWLRNARAAVNRYRSLQYEWTRLRASGLSIHAAAVRLGLADSLARRAIGLGYLDDTAHLSPKLYESDED